MQHKKMELDVKGDAHSNEEGPGNGMADNEHEAGGLKTLSDSDGEVGTTMETPPPSPPPNDTSRLLSEMFHRNEALMREISRLRDEAVETTALIQTLMMRYRDELDYSHRKTQVLASIVESVGRSSDISDEDTERSDSATEIGSLDVALGDTRYLSADSDEVLVFEDDGEIVTEADNMAVLFEDSKNADGAGNWAGVAVLGPGEGAYHW